MSRNARIFWWALALKLFLTALLPLTNDESYYWVWSQHPQLSYYDHPPFVAWLYKLGLFTGSFTGSFTDFGAGSVRWPGVIMAHATLAIWLRLLRRFLSPVQRESWLWLALLSPLVGGSALIITPDVPLLFFYALSLALFFDFEARGGVKRALGLGLSVGLGLSSKYMMVLFGLSLFPLLIVRPGLRRTVLRNLPWLVLGVALGTLPVWWWNWQHDFASLKFQTAHGLGHKVWKPSWTYEYILVQVGLIFPTVLVAAYRARKRLPIEFTLMSFIPPLFFFVTTFRGYVEGNWPIVAYPALFALAAADGPANKIYLKATNAVWALAFAGLALVVLLQPEWARDMKFKEFHEYDAAVAAVRTLPEGVPVFARSYQMAAKLSFELKRPICKVKGLNRVDFYDFIEACTPTTHEIFLVVQSDEWLARSAAVDYRRVRVIPIDTHYEIWAMERP